VQAIVIRTGYATLKGQLIRSVMYPKPIDFQFTKDLLMFVGFMFAISLIGFVYTIIIMILQHSHIDNMIFRSLDIITV
jgi:cation-transporting ATPase 13A3/4/5